MRALVTRREAADLGRVSETTVKKAVDQGVIPAERRGAHSLIEVEEVGVLAMLGALKGMRLATEQKRQVRTWLRSEANPPELELTPALVVRKVGEVEEASRRAERYARLRDEWIASDADIKGGEPVVKGSRVSVYTLAGRVKQGEPAEVLDEDFPHIPAEAREVAVQYARANPRRGRPRPAAPAR